MDEAKSHFFKKRKRAEIKFKMKEETKQLLSQNTKDCERLLKTVTPQTP